MGFLRDSIVMDAGAVELRMYICEGEYPDGDRTKPLMTRLDFYEARPQKKDPKKGHRDWAAATHREWFPTLKLARERQRAAVPAMLARYLQLIAEHGEE